MTHKLVGWTFDGKGCLGEFSYFFGRFFCALHGQGTSALMTAGETGVGVGGRGGSGGELKRKAPKVPFQLVLSTLKISRSLQEQHSRAQGRLALRFTVHTLPHVPVDLCLPTNSNAVEAGDGTPSVLKRPHALLTPAQLCSVFTNPVTFPLSLPGFGDGPHSVRGILNPTVDLIEKV